MESFILDGAGAGARRLTTQSRQVEIAPGQTVTIEGTVPLYPALDGSLVEVLGVRTIAFKRNIGSN
ncbi:MAG TPA: hypothetical protein VEQ60_14565 [Longimicrobium sp.]|nr:hypothetical protein [Longimicrobium sp.]